MFRHSAGDCISWVSGSDSELIGFVFFFLFFLFLPFCSPTRIFELHAEKY